MKLGTEMRMPFNSDNWKKTKKIDPDFDIVVKTFLSIIRLLRSLTDEGSFAIRDELLPVLMNDQGRRLSYDGKELLGFLGFSPDEMMGDVKKEIEKFLKLNGGDKLRYRQKAKKDLISLTRRLPQSGRKFYFNKIESLFNGTLLKPIVGLPKEGMAKTFKSNLKIYYSIVSSLMCRVMMQGFKKLFEVEPDSDDTELLMESIFSIQHIGAVFFAVITNGLSIDN